MAFANVLTLVATPPHSGLESKQIQLARAALIAAGAEVSDPRWLAPGIAADLFFGALDPEAAALIAEEVLDEHKVDAIAQKQEGRRKKLLLADMDSTMIQQECLDELADYAGIKAETAAITERAMRGELEFKAALRERVAKLKGLEERALYKTLERLTLMPGAQTLLRTLRGHGVDCHLVSGGFRFFTKAIAHRLDFTSEQGNDLVIHNGKLTGEVAEPVLDKDSKLSALYRFAADNALSLEETMAVGDGANDIPMLQAAGMGVALHAKPKVNAQARARVKHSDLTALLYIQGYSSGDISV